jgi:hypothetical protein
MYLKAKVAAGTTVQQVAEALKPVMEYLGHDVTAFEKDFVGDDEFLFDPVTGNLQVSTYGEVGYSYSDLVVALAANLGRIVAEPGEIRLYDHDAADIDEAKTVIEFGPSDEAIKAYIAKRDIEAGLKMMEPHLSAEKLEEVRRLIEERP